MYQRGKWKINAMKTAIETVEAPYMLVINADYAYYLKD